MTTPAPHAVDLQQAEDLVRRALLDAVPGCDLTGLTPDAPLRDALDMDSLDFLAFIESLHGLAGIRVDEDDYPALRSLTACAQFVQAASSSALLRRGPAGRDDGGGTGGVRHAV